MVPGARRPLVLVGIADRHGVSELGVEPGADQEQRVAVADFLQRPGDALRLDGHGVEVGVVVAPVLVRPEFGHAALARLTQRLIGLNAVFPAMRQQVVEKGAGTGVDAERRRVLPSDLDGVGLDLDDRGVGRDRLPVDGVDVEEARAEAQHQIGLAHQRVRRRMAEMTGDAAGQRMVLGDRAPGPSRW